MSKLYFLALILLFPIISDAQSTGIRGKIINEKGDPLPYATVYIKELGTGAVANDDGYFEIGLTPGTYNLVFQYLGTEAIEKSISVGNDFLTINVTLKTQLVVLKDIIVSASDEDPAYAIMRKAIAKARYHTQQIDSFSAKVYIKGNGRLIDAPFYVRKALKKEGIDSTKNFVSETLSEVQYKRPGTYTENVISIRSSGNGNNTEPMQFINGSLYQSKLGGIISPLSPKAFSYYRFEYMGTFMDREYAVSKIKITPRVKGEDVLSGYIQIVEDLWSIHSADVNAVRLGISFNIKQIYAPIEEKAWLPVSHHFYINGKFWGFTFEYTYLASVKDYQIFLNPELIMDLTVVDEKSEKELSEQTAKLSPNDDIKKIQEQLEDGEEVNAKDLRKVLRAYQKTERKNTSEPETVFKKDFHVDSLARSYDSVYWANTRPIPLNEKEIMGYAWQDSLAEVQRKESEGDSTKSNDKESFKPFHLLIGGRYKIGEKAYFSLSNLHIQYNTVEGWNLEYRFDYNKTFKNKNWFSIKPVMRYGFSSQTFYPKAKTEYAFGKRSKRTWLSLEGGKYISQLNPRNPVDKSVNSFTTLFLMDNVMKLYEKEYLKFDFTKNIKRNIKVGIGTEWGHRNHLENTTDYRLIDQNGKTFSSNDPENVELDPTTFVDHQAHTGYAYIELKPGMRYYEINEYSNEISNTAPTILIQYNTGLKHANSQVDFHKIHGQIKHSFDLGRNNFETMITGGTFIGNSPEIFLDYQHFMGNETPFLHQKHFDNFRLLEYYKYSTSKEYLTAHAQYNPGKLLLTQFTRLRYSGLRERIFVNYLGSQTSNNYFEVGFTVDNIFRFLKVEAISSYQNGSFREFGFRIGIASFLKFTENGIRFDM